nr:ABC transporter permease [Acidobacteriota bacterium]
MGFDFVERQRHHDMTTERPSRQTRLPWLTAAIFRLLLPHAERSEVLGDLAAEYGQRGTRDGRTAARLWLWRQLVASIPALLRRSWWRGWTGFEPRANRMKPGGPMCESWIMDLRYSARRLTSRPTYALLAIFTLALGAGGTAAVFSIVRELLIAPLPIAHEEQVGVLWQPHDWTEEEFLYLRPNFPGFQRMAAYRGDDATLEVDGQALRLVPGIASSAELFEVLGAAPLLGRTFQAGDDAQGVEAVIVLSHGLWRELGGDPAILGRQLQLGGVARTVVGVMPPGFWFPNPAVRAWTATPLSPQSRSGNYALVGRVADGSRIDAMQGPLAALSTTIGERFRYPPQWDKTRAPAITPVRDYFVGDVRPSLIATFVAMTLILAIACVNVAALMLGQLGGRSTEMAVRAALGAGRGRLTQQLVFESLLIGLGAGAAGALLAAVGFNVLVSALPLGALAEGATLDWTLFTVAIAVALLAASAVAVVPGIAIWRSSLRATMATSRTGGISGRGGQLESALVVAQIALAVLLAAGAGLLIRSVANLRAIDPGFEVGGRAVVDATMPAQLPLEQRRRVILDTVAALQTLPAVNAVAATQKLPLRGSGDSFGIRVEGKPNLESGTTFFRVVTHDYFRTLNAAVRRGRGFDSSDRNTTEPVVVINEALALKYFPGEDPVGHVLHSGFGDRGERIVGVVENIAEADLTDTPAPARYMLYEQVPYVSPEVSFVITAVDAQQVPLVIQTARRALHTATARLAVQGTVTMQSVFDDAVGAPGRVATLLSVLAGLALLLGAIGVYGVISHAVARRTRDYGIHIALGLPPARVIMQVVSRGVRLVGLGSAIGVIATVAFAGPLSTLLHGVDKTDPAALGGAVVA